MKTLILVCLLSFLVHASFGQMGTIHEESFMHDDSLRSYLLYVPADYDDTPWPLVINMHGADSSPGIQVWLTGMNEIADTAHFLVAYPEGLINREGLVGWNDGTFPDILDDVDFIDSMIDTINVDFAIEQKRVYATGMSNGSGMSFTLACTLPTRIAAIGMVAAPGILEECSPNRPVPTLYMHGTADLVVPFEGGMGIFVPVDFLPARERLQFWVDHNGCTGEPEVVEFEDINTADSSTVTLELYTNCNEMSEVAFYEIEGGGHTWAGGPPVPPGLEFLGNVNLDINASKEIWNFFSRHVHPDVRVGITEAESLSGEIELLQNYPNPFYSQTTIGYKVEAPGEMKVAVYDLLGREVAVLFDGYQHRGQYEITFDGASLPSGLYIYSINTANLRYLRKMIVIR